MMCYFSVDAGRVKFEKDVPGFLSVVQSFDRPKAVSFHLFKFHWNKKCKLVSEADEYVNKKIFKIRLNEHVCIN